MAAMKVQGGRMVPLGRDTIARRDWLRNREFRLKAALESGSIQEAMSWVSDIESSAKPGDILPERLSSIKNALRQATSALNEAEAQAKRGVVVK